MNLEKAISNKRISLSINCARREDPETIELLPGWVAERRVAMGGWEKVGFNSRHTMKKLDGWISQPVACSSP